VFSERGPEVDGARYEAIGPVVNDASDRSEIAVAGPGPTGPAMLHGWRLRLPR
jgi:hypothetical protein